MIGCNDCEYHDRCEGRYSKGENPLRDCPVPYKSFFECREWTDEEVEMVARALGDKLN
jgi:hypothetical protein